MKRQYHILSWILLLMCSHVVAVKAQMPIEDLLTKYEDQVKMGYIKTFNLTKEELNTAKQVSLNLGLNQKKLILETDQQYTLTYTGNSPSLNSFYDETISIIQKNKNYNLSKEYTLGEMKKATYTQIEDNKIKELITLIQSSNSIIILISKGNFEITEAQFPE